MKRNKFKILGIFLLTTVIAIGFSGCKSKYVKYDNIDEIKYAEPTEYAKNFDIEGHISKLPEVEYKKIDYPVKETYTYKFNGYEMTIDIPEGFEVREIPLKEKPKIVNSTSIEDSCVKYGMRSIATCGNDKGFFMASDPLVTISPRLEVFRNENEKILLYFQTSSFKGISTWDAFVRYVIPIKSYDKKYQNGKKLFVVWSSKDKYERYGVIKLMDDKKYVLNIGIGHSEYRTVDKNLFFSILDSIKIEKKK